MEKETALQASRKKRPAGQAVVVALLAIHGIVLIVFGLIAFFGGFVGAFQVSNGQATPGAMVAAAGVLFAWIFLLGGIVSFLCAQGLWTRQRWAFWSTIALEATNVIVGGCALLLRLFTPLPIAVHMVVAGGILLYVLIVIDPHTFSD